MMRIPARKRVAVLISGRGSNMAALVEAAKATDYPAQIALVASNKPDAEGLIVARQQGIATFALSHKDFPDRETYDRAIHVQLLENAIDLVALAGFMRVLSPWFCRQWAGQLINIHPSLLPEFKGVDTHQRALDAKVREHGCSVHYVTPELDDGPVILQARVQVLASDDAASLALRVLKEEHRIYPLALAIAATTEANR